MCRRCRGRPPLEQKRDRTKSCPSDADALVRADRPRRCCPSVARSYCTARTTIPGAGVRLACVHIVDIARSRPEVRAQVRKPGVSLAGPAAVQRPQAARTLGSTPVTSRTMSLILSVLDQTRRVRSAPDRSILFWCTAGGKSQIRVLEVGRAGRLHERVLRQYDRRLCPRTL